MIVRSVSREEICFMLASVFDCVTDHTPPSMPAPSLLSVSEMRQSVAAMKQANGGCYTRSMSNATRLRDDRQAMYDRCSTRPRLR